jgi:hypothetical protein
MIYYRYIDSIQYEIIKTLRLHFLQDYKKELNKCYNYIKKIQDPSDIEPYSENLNLKNIDIRYLPFDEECIECVYDWYNCKYFAVWHYCPYKCHCVS